MAVATELFGRLAEDLAPPRARLSKMFGMPCLKDPNGKAFVGLHEGELVVRCTATVPNTPRRSRSPAPTSSTRWAAAP
jgi:hypothetical protein